MENPKEKFMHLVNNEMNELAPKAEDDMKKLALKVEEIWNLKSQRQATHCGYLGGEQAERGRRGLKWCQRCATDAAMSLNYYVIHIFRQLIFYSSFWFDQISNKVSDSYIDTPRLSVDFSLNCYILNSSLTSQIFSKFCVCLIKKLYKNGNFCKGN